MKVYYIGNRYEGCYYVRCLLPLIYNGWDGQKTSIYGKQADNNTLFKGAMAADTIVFQRPSDPAKVYAIDLLKLAGKKIVFDNDDTYKANAGVPTQMLNYKDEVKLNNINTNLNFAIEKSDLVTTTTEFLAEEYRKLNKNVMVLPNLIDPEDWNEPVHNETDKVRIGMVGSVLTNLEYEHIQDTLKKLSDRDDVQLVILGLPKGAKKGSVLADADKEELKFWKEFKNIEWHEWVQHSEYNSLLNELRLDIMLIPRHDSYFNRCKSNVKFLEASMCEVPVIAQGFKDKKSPYEVNTEDTKYCKIVTDNSQWSEVIDDLIEHPKKREQMGKDAREYVIANYNIKNKFMLWENAYKTMFE